MLACIRLLACVRGRLHLALPDRDEERTSYAIGFHQTRPLTMVFDL